MSSFAYAMLMQCRELHQQILQFAAGLRALGLQPGEQVSLFSENSARWIVADQGIMMNGAADAVSNLRWQACQALCQCRQLGDNQQRLSHTQCYAATSSLTDESY